MPRSQLTLGVARVLAWFQIAQMAEGTFLGIIRFVLGLIVTAVSDRLSQSAIETLQFPRIDRQVVGFEEVIFAYKVAMNAFRILRALSIGGFQWFHRFSLSEKTIKACSL